MDPEFIAYLFILFISHTDRPFSLGDKCGEGCSNGYSLLFLHSLLAVSLSLGGSVSHTTYVHVPQLDLLDMAGASSEGTLLEDLCSLENDIRETYMLFKPKSELGKYAFSTPSASSHND